jgi:hypothetical protein
MSISRPPRRPRPGYRFASAFVLGLALVVTGGPRPGRIDGAVSAQALNPCALLTVDEIQPLAANTSVADGVSNSLPSIGYVTCRYTWGVGTGRFKLDVTVTEASRMFPGMSPDQIKQRLLESSRPGTGDAVIPEIGEAAVFRPESPVYAGATAFVKGRILQVYLDGVFAVEKKDQIIQLLKSAASRL